MKALKIIGAAVAAIIVILAVVMIVGIPSGFLTSAIQDRVERQTGYRLTIAGETRISLWPTLNVTLSDLTLQEPKDREGASRVTIGSLQADMTLSSAWSGHPRISELIVTRPVLYTTSGFDGSTLMIGRSPPPMRRAGRGSEVMRVQLSPASSERNTPRPAADE